MTTQVTRQVGYTGTLQRIVWPQVASSQITAYLWGGGGGSGGNDTTRAAGGAGSGGGHSEVSFVLNPGDVLDVAIGGGGGAGSNSAGGAPGGPGGASYVGDSVFNTRNPPGGQPQVFASTWPSYSNFMNTWGVWEFNQYEGVFVRSYTVNFPSAGPYTFRIGVDNYAEVSLDGNLFFAVPYNNFAGSPLEITLNISAGNHTISWVAINLGGPGSFAMTIDGGIGYSGGSGSAAGPVPFSGGGGGGGGATVLLLNNNVIAVAGGGGGGGGAGNPANGVPVPSWGQSAPVGTQSPTSTAGQNAQARGGDGGGSGGGGGGAQGGNGGAAATADVGGFAGAFGTSLGSVAQTSSTRSAANSSSPFYFGTAGLGGLQTGSGGVPGNAGYAAFVFAIPALYVNSLGTFVPVKNTFIRDNNSWKLVKPYVRDNSGWKSVIGTNPPIFSGVSGNFGVASRPYS